MAHPNEELVGRSYEAFDRGDMDTVRGTIAKDVVCHIGGRGPFAGKDGVGDTKGSSLAALRG